MKNIFILSLASLLTAAGSALAQNQSDDHATHHPVPSTTEDAAASKGMTEGEVRRVDVATKKIMLKHGEIKNLGMGAMTMVFQVHDPALLSQVQAGDKVRFRAEQIKGAFVVTLIEKVAP
jgi:Cu/Ag efflux protein CusF